MTPDDTDASRALQTAMFHARHGDNSELLYAIAEMLLELHERIPPQDWKKFVSEKYREGFNAGMRR